MSLRQKLLLRKAELWNERSSWMSHWREISEYQQPRMGRFFITDVNRGDKRHGAIYDNTAIYASRTLAAGMMSGMTSPARPWFKFGLRDKKLMKNGEVKTWLYDCAELMRAVFAHSNTYRSLHTLYEELGLFGTAATVVLPDFDNVLHHYPLTAGEFAVSTDYRGKVDTLVREMQMTVGQLVGQFGIDKVSPTVKNAFDRGAMNVWIPVIHIIEPRKNRDTTKGDAKEMPWSSVYFESASGPDLGVLSESGFKVFPVLAPRWAVTGNDIYGNSPGMEALGDVKQLQHQQLRKAQAIDYQVNPPIQVPTTFKDAAKNRLPGGVMFVDATSSGQGVRTAFEVQLNLQHLLEDVQDVRGRIRTTYYSDLFQMLANDNRSGITATEIAERHEEKLLMLGPVLERLQNELLQPLIDQAFDFCSRAGILPPAPQVLADMDLNVEFIGPLAQAQRMVGAQGLDRLIGTVGTIAALKPDVVDKIDFDQAIDDYSDMYGMNPQIVIPTEALQEQRAARAKAQAAQAQLANAPAMASAAKDMAVATGKPIPTDAMQGVQGYSTPGATAI